MLDGLIQTMRGSEMPPDDSSIRHRLVTPDDLADPLSALPSIPRTGVTNLGTIGEPSASIASQDLTLLCLVGAEADGADPTSDVESE